MRALAPMAVLKKPVVLLPRTAIRVAVLTTPVVFLYIAPVPMAVLAWPVVLLESASVPSAVLPLPRPASGDGTTVSEKANENSPIVIATNVLFQTARKYLLGIVCYKIHCDTI